MAGTKDIKRRQTSVKNTQQVTKAMQMVAASKMRKSQTIALESRPYAIKALSILSNIKMRQPDIENVFLDGRPDSKKILAVVVTSDKGLCGGLNSSVIRESNTIFNEYNKDGYELELVLVGLKSKYFFDRTGLKIHKSIKGAGDYVLFDEIKPISKKILEIYKSRKINKVVAIYTEFISTLKQRVLRRQILPIREDIFRDLIEDVTPETGKYSDRKEDRTIEKSQTEYIFEPGIRTVLKNLVPFLLDIYIYHIILESNASEHSARMVAMKNASDNAENILKKLTLSYNKARQANITKEIAEITAGAEALR